MSLNKEKYRQLCLVEPTIPIFSRDWWLDAVCETENWDVGIVEKNGKIVASFPYYSEKKIFKYIKMPSLTQTMGVWISYPHGQKYTTKLSYETKILDDLIDQLPHFDGFNQSFHHSIENWLPFYWKGFKETTRYTYVIDDMTDLDFIYRGFKENIRREIKKAKKNVRVYEEENIEKFYEINTLTFRRQEMDIPYSLEFLKQLDEACAQHGSRRILFAEDEKGRIHGALYLVWDNNSAYYLMGGGDPDLRTSGASSLLMWEAIQFASTVTSKFDFEGSMIKPIERFFRSFGAVQKPYFHISKVNSPLLKWKMLFRP